MSYDYLLLRVREPVRCLNELTQEIVSAKDWYDEAREILRVTFPELHWSEEPMRTRGDGSHLETVRLEIVLVRAEITRVFVHGSFHADQREFVRRLSAALATTAFDCQTGQALAGGG
jgi:hypothetical protein